MQEFVKCSVDALRRIENLKIQGVSFEIQDNEVKGLTLLTEEGEVKVSKTETYSSTLGVVAVKKVKVYTLVVSDPDGIYETKTYDYVTESERDMAENRFAVAGANCIRLESERVASGFWPPQ